MTRESERTDELRRQIALAFPEHPIPRKEELIDPSMYSSIERDQIAALLDGRSWRAFTVEVFRRNHWDSSAILNFISEIALVYYYPAFLMVGLNEHDQADLEFQSAINCFLPFESSDDDVAEWRLKRQKSFSTSQLNVVRNTFAFVAENYSDEYERNDLARAILAIDKLLIPPNVTSN